MVLDKSLVDAGTGDTATRGAALGKRVAASVLRKRAGDGSAAAMPHQEGTKPGEYRFTTTAALTNPTRDFRSFSEAARENADSRVKAGLHFRFATTAGLARREHRLDCGPQHLAALD